MTHSLPVLMGSNLRQAGAPPRTAASLPRLRVSENRRYLATADGRPFFWLADTAWEMLHRLDRDETLFYLDTRRAQGFNVIQTVLLAEMDGIHVPNRRGRLPLRAGDPLAPDVRPGPDDDFWDDVDWVLDRAAERGLYIALLPTWGEWVTPRFAPPPVFAEPAQGYGYGRFLGERMRTRSNLVWVLGGDRLPDEQPHGMQVWRAMAQGIVDGVRAGRPRDGRAGSGTLMSYHSMPSSSRWWHAEPWLDFHMWGTYHTPEDYTRSFQVARADRALADPKPTLNAEPPYEEHPRAYNAKNGYFEAHEIRRAAWWSVLSGALGHTYGAHPVWFMAGAPAAAPSAVQTPTPSGARMDWREALALPVAGQMLHLRALFESVDFLSFEPDDALAASALDETGKSGPDHVVGGRGSGFALVYTPTGRTLDIGLGRVGVERVVASWYDPRVGETTPIGIFEGRGRRLFDPPGEEGPGNDWVLVLRAG